MAGEWSFLLDECVDTAVAHRLDSSKIDAEPVKDALWLGADDFGDVLPHARRHDQILVTSNDTDFRAWTKRTTKG